MTKAIFVLILTSALSLSTFGQTDKEVAKKTFIEYSHALEQKNYEKVLDYLYPKLLKLAFMILNTEKDCKKKLQGLN